MRSMQTMLKLRRTQIGKIREREYKKAYTHFSGTLKKEQRNHQDEIEEIRRLHAREMDAERKRVVMKLRELTEIQEDLSRKHEILNEKLRLATEYIGQLEHIRARMDGAITTFARAVQLAKGAADETESVKKEIPLLAHEIS